MGVTEAIVAVVVAVLAGGGVGALLTARANAGKIGAEGDRTTAETFSTEWKGITAELKEREAETEKRHNEYLAEMQQRHNEYLAAREQAHDEERAIWVKRHQDCMTTLDRNNVMFRENNDAMVATVGELRGMFEMASAAAAALKERVAVIEDEQPAQQRAAVKEAVQEVVRQSGGLDPVEHGHPPSDFDPDEEPE